MPPPSSPEVLPTTQLKLIRGTELPSTQIPPASLLIGAAHMTMTLNEIWGELSSEQAIAPPGELREPTLPWNIWSSFTPAMLLQKTLRRILACTLPRQVIPAPSPTSVLLSAIRLLAI